MYPSRWVESNVTQSVGDNDALISHQSGADVSSIVRTIVLFYAWKPPRQNIVSSHQSNCEFTENDITKAVYRPQLVVALLIRTNNGGGNLFAILSAALCAYETLLLWI